MATYFHGNPAEIQGDGLQTLILMNPGYNVGYSDTTHQPPPPPPPPSASSNFGRSNSNNSFDAPLTTNTQQFVGIPLPTTSSVDAHPFHGLIPRPQYHFYGQFDQVIPAREINRAQQGLSLTLSSQEMGGKRAAVLSPTSGGGSPSSASASGISNNGGIVGTGVQSVLMGSKYLKATQELLEETVTVGKGKGGNATVKATRESPGGAGGGGEGETSGKSDGELTTVERQEIQMKKAKLVHMLDEVEQRYSQYHHQIQMVISWFEQVAGIGSARTYTALAVETISKQFRCLKNTILGQIKSASKSLGEEDEEEGKNEGSRLKFVDHQLRQQKTLQQLGMIQPNAWRPQRGLPERSVSVLRAWLFEHFLHPYPKDSDKQMLAKQTGLTRSQVSNWFINARVRLWKPMVEEMYMEETKEHEKTGSDEKKDNDPTVTIPTSLLSNRNPSLFALIDSSDMELEIHGSPKKQRSNNNEMEMNVEQGEEVIHGGATTNGQDQILMKFANDQRQTRDVGFSLLGAAPTNFIGGFGTYFGADQFPGGGYSTNNNGGVSLTLGLPHCENPNQSFLPNNNMGIGGRRVNLGEQQNEFGIGGGALSSPASSSSSHRPVVYETVNLQNRKRFSAHLMHDFVA